MICCTKVPRTFVCDFFVKNEKLFFTIFNRYKKPCIHIYTNRLICKVGHETSEQAKHSQQRMARDNDREPFAIGWVLC